MMGKVSSGSRVHCPGSWGVEKQSRWPLWEVGVQCREPVGLEGLQLTASPCLEVGLCYLTVQAINSLYIKPVQMQASVFTHVPEPNISDFATSGWGCPIPAPLAKSHCKIPMGGRSSTSSGQRFPGDRQGILPHSTRQGLPNGLITRQVWAIPGISLPILISHLPPLFEHHWNLEFSTL